MRVLPVVFLTVLLDLIGFGIVIPLYPFYAESMGASPLMVTLLASTYSLAQFFFAPLWGALSDRHGRRPILLLSIGMGTLAMAGFAWAPSLLWLFVFRALHGLFAANISVAQAIIADTTTPENRAKGMGMIGAAFGLGFTIGPFVGGELSDYGLATPIAAAAALQAFNFLLALAILPETRTGDAPSRQRPIDPAAFGRVLVHPVVGPIVTLSFLLIFAFSMMESTFSLFQEHQNHLGPKEVGRVLGVIGVVGVFVQGGAIGPLVRTFGEKRLIQVGILSLAAALLALAFAAPWGPLLGVAAWIAVSHGLLSPSLNAILSKRTPEADQGFVLGSNQSLGALARALAPGLGGLLFTHAAHAAPFLAGAALLGLGAALTLRVPNQEPQSSATLASRPQP